MTAIPTAICDAHTTPEPLDSEAYRSVRQAAEQFTVVPMPLAACLELRRHAHLKLRPSDPLATVQHVLASRGQDSVRQPELATLLRSHRLGEWALSPATINHLVQDIESRRPRSVLEFGCGSSTIALAWAMRRCWGAAAQPLVFSVEQSAEFLAQTAAQLETAGLANIVRLIQAPLVQQRIGRIDTTGYRLGQGDWARFLSDQRPEWVLIDGPAAGHGGRFGTLPSLVEWLAPGARVYLDDALRDSELSIVDWWSRLGYLEVHGILWIGKGLCLGCVPDGPIQPGSTARECLTDLLEMYSTDPAIIPAPAKIDPGDWDGTSIRGVSTPDCCSTGMAAEPATRRSCVLINTYYPGFLSAHYQRHPDLEAASYEVQHRSLIDAAFGDSDFYSDGLKAAGWQAHDLIVNCTSLQQSWMRHRGGASAAQGLAVAVEQMRELHPDVLYLHDLSLATTEFLQSVRSLATLIVGQIASPVPAHADLGALDIIVSSFPHFVEAFRRQGHTSYYQALAFDPRVLARLGNPERVHPVTFVGGLSPAHRARVEFVTDLARRVPLECWGYGTQALAHAGVEPKRLHGECWGMDMFGILRRSFLTVNHHIDVAQTAANNMRLFEATGCGALLITDYKDNLNDLFEVGTEVLAYRSVEECAELVTYCLAHRDEAAEIARRGQRRTLEHHTYRLRMAQTADLLERHLRARRRRAEQAPVDHTRVSYGKRRVDPADIPAQLATAWESPDIPARQRALVDEELALMWRGKPPTVFRVMARALGPHLRPGITVLEVGCASGYYYEVIEYLLHRRVDYTGVDVSEAMIDLARALYPHAQFQVGNGAALGFQDGTFGVVVSSCVLLHVSDYPTHIREAARVSSSVVVLHRTPICRGTPTQYFRKFAYGVETQELRFQEAEVLTLAASAGLRLHESIEFESRPDSDEFEVTYVFRKSVGAF